MVEGVLLSISLIVGISALLAIVARLIKQPPIIAYLAAGILVGPLVFNILNPNFSSMLQLFAHIGVAFLLFIVGLSLDLRVLKEVGGVSVLAGFIEVSVVGAIGYFISISLGYSYIVAIYIGAAIAFSSTVVVVKILSDKKEIDTLHGRIALGILIVQDFAAALSLMIIPFIRNSGQMLFIAQRLGFAVLLIVGVFLFSNYILNRFLNYLARSQEALFLFGIAWALILATIFDLLGFSLEIGALIAGMSLASSKYTLELGGKIKPLRDFFVVLFFVFFGSQLVGPISASMIKLALLFSIFVLIGKPLIVMIILRVFGYKKRTNFFAGVSLAQISEFSLILALVGISNGDLNQSIIGLLILIALITIAISSYGIYFSQQIFNKVSWLLGIFEGQKYRQDKDDKKFYDIILFGYHRIGYKILNQLKKNKASFVVVDYNPKVVLSLGERGINCIFGDASDKEFLNEINLDKAKLVVSTIPDWASNLSIQEKLKEIKSHATFIATSEHSKEALDLYEKGADFVIVPQHLGGNYAAEMITKFGLNKSKYREEGKAHFKEILEGKKNSNYYS